MKRFVLRPSPELRDSVTVNLVDYLMTLPADKAWRVEIGQHRERRSDRQRRSLFGVAYDAIMAETGLSGAREKEQLHWHMCGEFFGWQQTKLRGWVPIRTTTTNESGERDEISKERAMEMYRFIQRQAALCDVQVPDPDPFWRDKLEAE